MSLNDENNEDSTYGCNKLYNLKNCNNNHKN